jgi:nucleoside-diphosphate-sugar epimerase
MVIADIPKTKKTLSDTNSWVDVRDTALGHVLALEKDAAGGQRIIISSGASHVIPILSCISYIDYREFLLARMEYVYTS